ncbi:phosphohydrolase, partial [Streptomyces kasugaensis]
FGNVKADVLDRFEEGYTRPNFVRIIEDSPWDQ